MARATKSQMQDLHRRLAHATRALGMVARISPGYTAVWGASLVVQGLIPAAIVLVTRWLVDAVAAAIGGGLSAENVELVLLPAALMAGLLVLQQGLGALTTWVQTAQGELVQDELKGLIHAKAVSVDYGFYESSAYFDLLQEANAQASGRTVGVLRGLGALLQNALAFASIAVVLATYGAWLPVVLFFGTLPAVYVVVRHNRKFHAWWKETTRVRRWAGYLDILFMEPRFAAEMRLYDLGDHFRQEYRRTRDRLRGERLRLLRNQSLAGIAAMLQGLLVTAGVMAWMGWRALQGLATLGDLAAFYQAINQGQGLMRALLNGAGQLYTDTLFLEHLFSFLEIEPQLRDPDEPAPVPATLREGIAFEDVTFTYPGSTAPAIRNFSLEVPAGQTIAIVGSNGAGKSTLIKLLCRFYEPDAGRVLIDGTDLRAFSQQELRRAISVLFQHPVHYQATAHENVALGDVQTAQERRVHAAARGAGADEFIERLPRKYDTVLGRLFPEGTELSGGQWQRIALARAYLREAPILLLDEPTSFMDSWSENVWLRRFEALAQGRTVVIITHRFTTAMQADVIHVMEEGRIVESGTHEALVRQGGRYATSWREQMRQAEQRTEEEPFESGARGDGSPVVEPTAQAGAE